MNVFGSATLIGMASKRFAPARTRSGSSSAIVSM